MQKILLEAQICFLCQQGTRMRRKKAQAKIKSCLGIWILQNQSVWRIKLRLETKILRMFISLVDLWIKAQIKYRECLLRSLLKQKATVTWAGGAKALIGLLVGYRPTVKRRIFTLSMSLIALSYLPQGIVVKVLACMVMLLHPIETMSPK